MIDSDFDHKLETHLLKQWQRGRRRRRVSHWIIGKVIRICNKLFGTHALFLD